MACGHDLGDDILRCAVALAAWVYEYRDADLDDNTKIKALDEIMKELQKEVKDFKKKEARDN